MQAVASPKRRRLLAALRTGGAALALSAVFGVSATGALVVHSSLPPSRRLFTRVALQTVNRSLQGKITAESVDRLALTHLEFRGVTIADPAGKPVLQASRLEARVASLSFLRSLLFGTGDLELRIPWVRAESIQVQLEQDADGVLTLARTFESPPRPPAPPSAKPTKPARQFVLDIQHIEIGSAQALGKLQGLGAIDAETQKLHGALHLGSEGLSIDTARSALALRKPSPVPLSGSAEFHLRSPGAIWGYFTGLAGDVEISSAVKLQGNTLDATVDAPAIRGASLAAWVPGTKISQTIAARLEAHGDLPNVQTSLQASLGSTSVDIRGSVTLSSKFAGDLRVELRDLDLQKVFAEVPRTMIGANARVTLALDAKSKPQATVVGHLLPGSIASVRFPWTGFEAVVDSQGVSGQSQIHEPGMPIEAGFGVTREGTVTLKASTKIPSIDAAPRLGQVLRGSVKAQADARFEAGQVDVVLAADVQAISRGPARLRSGKLNVHAWGKPSDLLFDASLRGQGFEAGALKWNDYSVTARGPVLAPQVSVTLRDEVGPSVTTSAALSLAQNVAVRDLRVEVGRNDQKFTFRAKNLGFSGSTVDFGGISIEGLDSPLEGVLRVGATGFDVKLASEGVNLERLSRILSLPGVRFGGTATVDIDIHNSGSESSGCARLDLRNGRVEALSGIDASLRARFSGSHVEFDSNLALGAEKPAPATSKDAGACQHAASVGTEALAAASLGGDLVLQGSPLEPRAWRDSTGTARLTDLTVDLDRLGQMVQIASRFVKGLNLPVLKGKVRATAEAARDKPTALPSWTVTAATNSFAMQSKDLNLQKADLVASVAMEESGLLHSIACLRKSTSSPQSASCYEGDMLLAATANTNINYARLLKVPSEWRALLLESNTHAKLVVPDRSIADLLEPLGLQDASPVKSPHVGVSVEFSGTPLSPQFSLQGYVDRPTLHEDTLPALACLSGSWNGTEGTTATVLRRRSAADTGAAAELCGLSQRASDQRAKDAPPIGLVQSHFIAKWTDLLRAHKVSDVPVEMDATFKIDNLPLSDLGEGELVGAVSGSGGIKGLGRTPEFAMNFQVNGLRVGREFAYDRGSVEFRSDASGLRGSVELIDQSRSQQDKGAPGRLEAEIKSEAPVTFREGWIPGFEDDKEVKIRVKPSRFRLANLLPVVDPVLSYLEGDMSGYVDATWVQGSSRSRVDEAFLSVTNGACQIPTLGQEFTDLSVVVRTSAPNQLALEGFRAKAASGSVAGSGSVSLEGLLPKRILAALRTDEQNKIRLTIEGVPLGDVWGQVDADIKLGSVANDVALKLSGVHVELSEDDQRKVQALEENPEVRVVPSTIAEAKGSGWSQTVGEKTSKNATVPWRVAIQFAEPAQIERSPMRFSVTTRADGKEIPTLTYPDPSRSGPVLRGQVRLEEGRVDVVGKFFTIEPERALVTFAGDPANPELNVTARWDASDGTRVYADVTGTLKDMHVALRSDPARTPSEILAMILFGGAASSDVTQTSTSGGSGAAAAGVGSGVAAAGINRLLADVAPLGISTRIDATQNKNVRPTVVIEVARNVTAEATVNTGTIPLGQNPDRYLLTLDWRFLKKWSLRTTVGDAGSSILDVLWTHRY